MGEVLSHPIRELATKPAVTVEEADTLRAAARHLWEAAVGAAVVTRNGTPVGIVSERDIVNALAEGADPDEATTGGVMTTEIFKSGPFDRILDAAIDMVDREIRHLPLFDDAGRCVGVVSMRELVRPLLVDALEGHR